MEINNKIRVEIQKYIELLYSKYTVDEIETILINDFLTINNKLDFNIIKKYELYSDEYNGLMKSIELLDYAFELLIPIENKKAEGVVFTPEYIVDFIIDNLFKEDILNKKILDPACGTGVFLRKAMLKIKAMTGVSYKEIIERCLYGVDINSDNIRRVKIILLLECIIAGESYEDIKFNLFTQNALETELNHICDLEKGFDYIIGNPPYSNTHDLDKDVINYLKKNFKTTQKGTFNIFYAFIEHSMKGLKDEGELGFIIPNNFLKIEAAEVLRKFLSDNNYIKEIIDFTYNKIFSPVMTYNAIVFLNKKEVTDSKIKYSLIEKTNDIKCALENRETLEMNKEDLDEKMWNLLTPRDVDNIKKIKNVGEKIKSLIRTGIATLKDSVYILDGYDSERGQYYKIYEEDKYFIESTFVKPFYKISEIDYTKEIKESEQYIIFPYVEVKGKNEIVDEEVLKTSPLTYEYLSKRREFLMTRSSHNHEEEQKKKLKWYEYGRSQALKKFGNKLVYPTFSGLPKFTLLERKDVLFANGYAVFDDSDIDIKVIQKVLNSKVLKYFVEKTSYPISGGYYCYQKKYIADFSIPKFSENDIKFIEKATKEELDDFLICKYGLVF
ncbi:MAG: HsdM family class I SAM-dependent methyltransferase [Sarcina sp.]